MWEGRGSRPSPQALSAPSLFSQRLPEVVTVLGCGWRPAPRLSAPQDPCAGFCSPWPLVPPAVLGAVRTQLVVYSEWMSDGWEARITSTLARGQKPSLCTWRWGFPCRRPAEGTLGWTPPSYPHVAPS